jgi:predicted nucleic acid-binding protein
VARRFLDTSALIKLYVVEPDSPTIRAIVVPSDDLVISRLTVADYRAAVHGKIRLGSLDANTAQQALRLFERSLQHYTVAPLVESGFVTAEQLLDRFASTERLFTPDALILATAFELLAHDPLITFVTTDQTQARIALLGGLTVLP